MANAEQHLPPIGERKYAVHFFDPQHLILQVTAKTPEEAKVKALFQLASWLALADGVRVEEMEEKKKIILTGEEKSG